MRLGFSTFLLLAICVAPALAGTIQKEELDQQKDAYQRWWGGDLAMKLDELPTEGGVPDFRIPYSGHDYPDKIGGTVRAMQKYDAAFHGGRPVASGWEKQDVQYHRNFRENGAARRGLFARARNRGVPGWYGHCNGWTAATIRHAEPQQAVVRNGVTFTPADIKGLLAEIYMYSDSEFLGGVDPAINPGTLHLVLTNWVGRGSHPLGLESAIGEVVINFPLYKFKTKLTKLSDRQYEAETTVTYSVNTPQEHDKGPDFRRDMYLHYSLDLDEEGRITGGSYYRDSNQIDMLWAPLKPAQGGEKGNERGNPHIKLQEILSIWRESVPEETRKKWLNINPTEEDAILENGEIAGEAGAAAAAAEAAAAEGTEKPTEAKEEASKEQPAAKSSNSETSSTTERPSSDDPPSDTP
ncbi:MAG: hypothetical protein U0939_06300 [Pirellulales bacterium]